MTSRERWTVYPLLFLAIGLALRGQSGVPDAEGLTRFDGIDAARVVCRELRIDAEDGTTLVHVGRVRGGGGGRVEIRDSVGRDAISIGTRPGRNEAGVEFFDADGNESARLTADGLGGPPPEEEASAAEAAPSP